LLPKRTFFVFALSLIIAFLSFSVAAVGQSWSGVLAPSRAADWQDYAGIPGYSSKGALPSDNWTQSGSTISACGSNGSPVTAESCGIADALAKANGKSKYVLLGPGTFYLSDGLCLHGYNNVEVRGSGTAGSNLTKLVFSGAATCQGGNGSALIGFQGADTTYPAANLAAVCTATDGFSQGSSSLTIGSGCNQSITAGATAVILDQCDTGYSGSPCSGSAKDNGNYFVCGDKYDPSGTGCSENGPDSGLARPERFQAEWHIVSSCNPSCGKGGASTLTLAEPILHPNYSSGQTPQVYLVQLSQYLGVRNMVIDGGATNSTSGISFYNTAYPWVKNVAILNPYSIGVYLTQDVHGDVESTYCYNAGQNSTASDPSCYNHTGAFHVIANNICQQVRVCTIGNGTEIGSVIGYNFGVDAYTGDSFMFGNLEDCHSDGCDFNLYESNVMYQAVQDQVHGTHLSQTWHRNFFTGWESCSNGQCGTDPSIFNSSAADVLSYNRYGNWTANVLGTPGIHTIYQDLAGPSAFVNNTIWLIGSANGGVSPAIAGDPIVGATTMRWGNYDVANNAVLECTAAKTPISACTADERAEAAPVYQGLASPSTSFPPSYYYSSRPSWYSSSTPFPAIGPDVSNGNVGLVAGTLNASGHQSGNAAIVGASYAGDTVNTAWAGHVNAIPAMNCYLSVMKGLPDGTGSALTFDASACYGSGSTSVPAAAPAAPTGATSVVVH